MTPPPAPPLVPIFHSNNAKIFITPDYVVFDFIESYNALDEVLQRPHEDPKTFIDDPIKVLATPANARVVLTFMAFERLLTFCQENIGFARKARTTPPLKPEDPKREGTR